MKNDKVKDTKLKIKECVQMFLDGKELPPEIHVMIKEEIVRMAIRSELEEVIKKREWKMKMSDVLHSGCMVNYD